MKKLFGFVIIVFGILGIVDAGYLSYEKFNSYIPPCSTNILFSDCGKVLNSEYASTFGVPLSVIGIIQYSFLTFFLILGIVFKNRKSRYVVLIQSTLGFLFSLCFVYLQLWVIQAICLYCLFSALLSTAIFVCSHGVFSNERKRLWICEFGFVYKHIVKPIFFKFNPERVHTTIVFLGQTVGSIGAIKLLTRFCFYENQNELRQTICDISFDHPIGLAAGFDYEARLTQSLAAWGFGFQSVGTITNRAYGGNPGPMLGRLPKSKSLMVNKGFKNLGAAQTIQRLEKLRFPIPLGISIGRTNDPALSQEGSVEDIVEAFKKFEKSQVKNSYYELNISCPNLKGDVTFYPPQNLDELLRAIDKLLLTKPLFIKMPIEKNDREVLGMLEILSRHKVAGVIFGNLQKDRNNKAFVKTELAKFKVGNFSGKPTYDRSNELISLTYKHYGKRFVIIGCGGVFSTKDAYEKIIRGASLVQLITGMIFQGPQLVSQINTELADLLKKDGFKHISEAVGKLRI